MKPVVLCILTGFAGLAGGIFLCRWQPAVFTASGRDRILTLQPGASAGPEGAAGATAAQNPDLDKAHAAAAVHTGNPRALVELTSLFRSGDPFRSSAEIRQRLAGLTGADCLTLAAQLTSIRAYTPENQAVSEALFDRWSEADPDAMLNWALSPAARSQGSSSALNTMFTKIASRDLGKAKSMLARITDPAQKRTALYGIGAAAASDPGGVARLMESESSPGDWSSSYQMRQVLSTWANKDPQAAAAYVGAMKSTPMRDRAMEGLASTWACNDFDGAWQWANSLKTPRDRNGALPEVLASLAGVDPNRAAGLAMKLPNGQLRNNALAEVSQRWVYADKDTMLAWMDKLPIQDRATVVDGAAWYLSYTDPGRAMEIYEKLPPGEQRGRMISYLMDNLAGKDPELAIKQLERIPQGKSRADAMQNMIGTWAASDPKKAAAWLEKQTGPGFVAAAGTLTRAWAQEDPEAALSWALKHQSGADEDYSFASTALTSLAANDPKAAAEKLNEITDPKLRQNLVESLAASWTDSGARDAEKWARTLSAADQRLALRSIAGNLTSSQPEEASRILTELASGGQDSKDLEDTASKIAASRASYAAAESIEWATSLPSALQSKAVAGAVGQWVQSDRAGVSEWINNQPHGAVRDSATGALVRQLAWDDPETALTWSADIGDADQQRSAADEVFNRWRSRDPARTTVAIQASNLPAEEQQRLLDKLNK